MYYKIQKSLGRISAIQVDSIESEGICIEFRNYCQENPSILVYNNGKLDDIRINGFLFPCVYNNTSSFGGYDIYGGGYKHMVTFDYIDSTGALQHISAKKLYGYREDIVVEYFFNLIYCITCCNSIEQYNSLFKYIIDNKCFIEHKNRKEALEVLNFIEIFLPQLSKVENTDFLRGLQHKIEIKFKGAQEIISSSTCPK